jgi:hypothetical protein
MLFSCLECEEEFDSEKSLHAHIKKHNRMLLQDYYVKHFARKNLLTNELLPFKNKESYFDHDFNSIHEVYRWCDIANPETVKNYIIDKLATRIESRNLKFAPNEVELYVTRLPNIDIYKKHYLSYTYACDKIGVKPMFNAKLPDEFNNDYSNLLILTDSREQEPLYFKKQKVKKLDVGDYCIIDGFDYTFVDRKSEADFKTTVSRDNIKRFTRELERARKMNCYIFVVIEGKLEDMEKNNKKAAHVSNMNYIFHNMRLLQHEFRDCCQFVFSGSRKRSELFIPKLLKCGKKIWNTDVQYFINKL